MLKVVNFSTYHKLVESSSSSVWHKNAWVVWEGQCVWSPVEGGPVSLPTVHVEAHLFLLHHQLRDTSQRPFQCGCLCHPAIMEVVSRRCEGAGSHGESAPLLRHVRDGEGGSFAAVRRLISVSVVQQDALEAPSHWSEDQPQLHHLLMGIGDGKEDASSLRGRTHLNMESITVWIWMFWSHASTSTTQTQQQMYFSMLRFDWAGGDCCCYGYSPVSILWQWWRSPCRRSLGRRF